MPDPAIRVEGLNRLSRSLRRAGSDDLLEALRQANEEAVRDVERASRPMVPVRTGALAGSLRASATPRAGTLRLGRASIPYAGPIHFGWPARGIRPRPFLYEALDQRKTAIEQVFAERIERLVASIGEET